MSKMSKAVNALASTVDKAVNAANRNNQRQRNNRRRRRNPRRFGRRMIARGPQGILAGYGSPVQTVFSQKRTNDGLIVRGFDLVTAFAGDTNISYFMPANPVLWPGTRIAAIASGFQNYRPLKFVIHYRPQVGSDSTLSMFIGTIWQNNYITARDQIEPSLLTSPGGVYEPAWQSSMTEVKCGNNLPQRMYPIRDPSYTTIPFSVVARAAEGDSTSPAVHMPGRIFMEYTYEFRNAIGLGTGYGPAVLTTVYVHMLRKSGNSVWEPQIFCESLKSPAKGQIIDYSKWTPHTSLDEATWNNIVMSNPLLSTPSKAFPLFAEATWDEASTDLQSPPSVNRWGLVVNGTQLDTNEILETTDLFPYTGEVILRMRLTMLVQGSLPS